MKLGMLNLNQLPLWFGYLAIFSVLLPVFLYFKNRENFKNRSLNILAAILIIGGLTDFVVPLLTFQFKMPNMPLINIEFVIEFILISWLFSHLCPLIKSISRLIIPLFISLFIFTCLYWQNIYIYQSITHIVAAFIILGYVIRYYSYLLHQPLKIPIYQYTPFWILLAFYSYFIVNLFIYVLSNYFFYNQPANIGKLFWMTHSFTEIVKNILFSIGIYKSTQKATSLSLQF